MADKGEKRQIVARANANETEKVRASKKIVSEERSTEKASTVVGPGKGFRKRQREREQRNLFSKNVA
ncbi:MAG: hypothetical protein CXZ00_07445 [Acidobacteria bacterium]|nr:MAG: hypothetical protein CXZ00_07445 [Acidobacteriota bacterium]